MATSKEVLDAIDSLSQMASPERWRQMRVPLEKLLRSQDLEIMRLKDALTEERKCLAKADAANQIATLTARNAVLTKALRKLGAIVPETVAPRATDEPRPDDETRVGRHEGERIVIYKIGRILARLALSESSLPTKTEKTSDRAQRALRRWGQRLDREDKARAALSESLPPSSEKDVREDGAKECLTCHGLIGRGRDGERCTCMPATSGEEKK